MASITLQLYITDTLTVIEGVSIAIWNSGDTLVIESGTTNASGQLIKTLVDGIYNVKAFKTGYSITDESFTVSIVDAVVTIYGNSVAYGAKTYSYYKDRIVANLNNRNDATTLLKIMGNFNDVQEMLSKKQFEDLVSSTTVSLVTSQSSYTFSELSIDNVNAIFAVRLYDGTQWLSPMQFISALNWDRYYAIIYPIVEGKPTMYTRRAKKILFYTTPDDTYTINIICSLYATPVTEDSSSVDFSNIDGILINLTTAHTWLSLGEKEMADTYFAKAAFLMAPYEQNEIKNRYAVEQGISGISATLSK